MRPRLSNWSWAGLSSLSSDRALSRRLWSRAPSGSIGQDICGAGSGAVEMMRLTDLTDGEGGGDADIHSFLAVNAATINFIFII